MAEPGLSQSQFRRTSIRRQASGSGIRSRLTLSRGWIRRNIWAVPLIALAVLVVSAYWLRSKIEEAIRAQQESELQTLLSADVTALEIWLKAAAADSQAAAHDPELQAAIRALVEMSDGKGLTTAELIAAQPAATISELLEPLLGTLGYHGYVIIDPTFRIVGSGRAEILGQTLPDDQRKFVEKVFKGQATVSVPFASMTVMPDEWGRMSAGVPTMFAGAPVKDDQGKVIAALGLRIRPDLDFTKILNVARTGETGETYAFNKSGLLLSQSRFEDDLKRIGLQADNEFSRSVLSLEIRDPGVDMTTGARPAVKRSEQPLTRMAADAVQGNSGVEGAGYRDYRGVPVIGAWTWLPEYDFGVATEIDQEEAHRPVAVLRRVFWGLVGLLSIATLGLLGMTLLAGRLERRVRDAVVAAGKLGQYALESQIGAGGMGAVYKARHAMLRRPTAIKLLEPSKASEVAIERFEREVQLTSQLNHPNTITIYDYGRTPEGVFYYAMEYLEGYSLQTLVERFGPLPDGRAIPIVMQICGSLIEAHGVGLIHRDIKPANIMLARRGGMCDFAKLLDFGLVKSVDTRQMRVLTAADSVTGTPLYMPPESMQDDNQPDARSDLYSLGGVAYFLLTGEPVFEGRGILDIIRAHAESDPVPPSKRVGIPISADFERWILRCLAKSPADRPASAAELADGLSRCVPSIPWPADEAKRWWDEFHPGSGLAATKDGGANTQGLAIAPTIDLTAPQRK